jgi:hypothetical protein
MRERPVGMDPLLGDATSPYRSQLRRTVLSEQQSIPLQWLLRSLHGLHTYLDL